MPPSKILLTWIAPEFIKQQKTILWDIGIFIATAAFILWGVWSLDVTIVVLAILAGGLLWHFGKQEPKEIMFQIRTDGVQINNLLYKYQTLESFCIFHEPPHITELVLRSKKALLPLIHINLGGVDPDDITKVLREFIEEKQEAYPISHIIGHIIGY